MYYVKITHLPYVTQDPLSIFFRAESDVLEASEKISEMAENFGLLDDIFSVEFVDESTCDLFHVCPSEYLLSYVESLGTDPQMTSVDFENHLYDMIIENAE